MERLGIFGGTFDPPHNGHLSLAGAALEQLDLARVLWVLTPNPPHKPGRPISPLEDRLEMLKLALAEKVHFELSRVDIDRLPPHYAVETVRLLRSAHPGATLVYLIGADSLRDLPRWSRPEDLIEEIDELGIMRRPGVSTNLGTLFEELPGLTGKLRWIESPPQDISSTQLRAMASSPASLAPFVPAEVLEYIRESGLYRSDQA